MPETQQSSKSFKDFLIESFDKLLLFCLFIFTVVVVLHMTHDQKDTDQILWARETAGTVLGALLGLITGHALATSRATATTGGGTQTTITAEGKN